MGIPRRALCAGAMATLLLFAPSIHAATYRVPSDVPTIQAALNLTQPGDSVLVAPGNYPENLTMRSGVVLFGEQGAAVTIVDGRFLAPVINCDQVIDFLVRGLTLRRGYNANYPGGAGVAMNFSRGDFLDCIFVDNRAGRDGGGISIVDSQATIRGSTFRDNTAHVAADLDGGGVFCYRSFMQLEDCLIVDNLAHEGAAIAVVNLSTAEISRCIIVNNEATASGPAGAGIAVANSSARIENNSIVGNITPFAGASVLIGGNSTFERNIIANATGVGITCGGGATLLCNDVWNSDNTDYQGCPLDPSNFSADPRFCNLANLDLRIDESSPCAPSNSPPGCGLIGALDVGCGATAVEPVTWGGIKARYGEAITKGTAANTPH